MALAWPPSVGARLSLLWDGVGGREEVLRAGSAAYFELTGVHAVADAEGIGPVLYRSYERARERGVEAAETAAELAAGVAADLAELAAETAAEAAPELAAETAGDAALLTVTVIALGRRCAWMALDLGRLRAHHIGCWRGADGRSAPIPAAARIGILALDGDRIRRR